MDLLNSNTLSLIIVIPLWLLGFAFGIYCAWTFVCKMGHPGRICLLFYIPVLNIAFILYLVFSEWPIERELNRYKKLYGSLPNEDEKAALADSKCLECGAFFPVEADICPSCGWTFMAERESE